MFWELKGSFTIFLFSVRTHILDSNEVWYSWFWSEGSINALNPKFLDFYFVPRLDAAIRGPCCCRDLVSRRQGPRIAAAGTSYRGARLLCNLTLRTFRGVPVKKKHPVIVCIRKFVTCDKYEVCRHEVLLWEADQHGISGRICTKICHWLNTKMLEKCDISLYWYISYTHTNTGCFFLTGTPLKVLSVKSH